MEFHKYQGAGNDFLVADNRNGEIILSASEIASLCDRRYGVGADGLMLLENSLSHDFSMKYYNSDGSGGMMCGNGGRCIVAFAADLGITRFDFDAPDGFHTAVILAENGKTRTVRLKMIDVKGIATFGNPLSATVPDGLDGYFLDTGTRHFVKFVDSVGDTDIFNEGRKIRYCEEFAPIGTNVNFVELSEDILSVRTYEKGVEDETFACGTGITASAIAAYHRSRLSGEKADNVESGRVRYDVRALKDRLAVDFVPEAEGATDVWLTGPATYVCKVLL